MVSFQGHQVFSPTQAALLSPDIQKKIENFKNKDIDNSQILIDDASAELSNIFISAASISLKRGTKSKKVAKIRNGMIQILSHLGGS
jgi:hypothetical protein